MDYDIKIIYKELLAKGWPAVNIIKYIKKYDDTIFYSKCEDGIWCLRVSFIYGSVWTKWVRMDSWEWD